MVDDNDKLREHLEDIVRRDAPNREVLGASNESEAIRLLDETSFDLVITDINLEEGGGSPTGGLSVLRAVLERDERIPVIVVTAFGTMQVRESERRDAQALSVKEVAKRLGCFAFVPRPFPGRDYLDVVREAVARAIEARSTSRQ